MTETEHLLDCITEECAEIIQRVSKALRFGLREVQPGQDLTNEQRIVAEFHDLRGVLEMLHARGLLLATDDGLLANHDQRDAINAKKHKVRKFLDYSRSLGTLTEER